MRPTVICSFIVIGLPMAGVAPAPASPATLAKMESGTAPEIGRGSATYAPLIVSIPHHLAEAEAERRVKDALAGLQKDYGYLITINRQVWRGPHLRFEATVMGQPAHGRIDVGKSRVEVNVMMPSSLSMLVDLAQPVLLKQGTQMLAKQ